MESSEALLLFRKIMEERLMSLSEPDFSSWRWREAGEQVKKNSIPPFLSEETPSVTYVW